MRYGKRAQWFEQLAEEGHAVSAPPCPDMTGLEWIWEAWNDLGTCRQIGMDLGPVPWDAVNRYAIRHGLDDEDYDLLWSAVKALDRIHREHIDNERKHASDAKRNASRRNSNRR